jgi:hypothetical protein
MNIPTELKLDNNFRGLKVTTSKCNNLREKSSCSWKGVIFSIEAFYSWCVRTQPGLGSFHSLEARNFFLGNLHFSNMASSVVTLGKAPLSVKGAFQYVTTLRLVKLCRICRSRLVSGIRTTKYSTIVAKKNLRLWPSNIIAKQPYAFSQELENFASWKSNIQFRSVVSTSEDPYWASWLLLH